MDLGRVLLDLLVIVIAARVAAEVAERLRQPAVLAEIVVGVLIGPSLLGFVHDGEALSLLAEIGVLLLLFEVGREMDPRDLMRVGGASLRVAAIGVAAPMALGLLAARAIGVEPKVALFLAGAITATSVGITARVFGDLRSLSTSEARTVLGAAVADDVIGLLVLAVVTQAAVGDGVDAASVAGLLATAVGFVVGAAILGSFIVPRLLDRAAHGARTEGTLMALGLSVALGFARLAYAARLAPIVGAFVAGLAVGRSRAAEDLHRRLVPLGHFFIPIFFLRIGVETDLGVFTDPAVLRVAGILVVAAVLGKIVSGAGVRRGAGDRMLVGIGMLPRGEVGLIFASLGLSSGVLDARDYGALVVVVLVTTLLAPPWIRQRIERKRRALPGRTHDVIEPEGGWLRLGDDVELAGMPPDELAAPIALQAAAACADLRPGPKLVEWLRDAGAVSASWDEKTRAAFFSLLRDANPRSWRFLEMTGQLARLLPAFAEALRRRPIDPFDLDPERTHRFAVLEGVRRIVDEDPEAAHAWKLVARTELVLLAALAWDVLENDPAPEHSARELAVSMGLDDEDAETLALLVSERHLLQAAAARPEAGAEETLIELAAHIGSRERAVGLYLLTLAAGTMEPWERERVDTLYRLVLQALEDTGLTGRSASALVERRHEEVAAIGARADVRERLDAAPRRYLLTQSAETIARHLRMTEVRPGPFEVRLEADTSAGGRWTIHVSFSDRRGALAAVAGAFARHGIAVTDAQIFTWRNGVAVDVFGVEADVDTDWQEVQRSMEASLREPGVAPSTAVVGEVNLDNVASPWQTIVEIRADDRAGLLHRVASAMASAGIQIHQAAVATRDGRAVDTFWVTGRNGGKLDQTDDRRLRASLGGKRPSRWRSRGARRADKPGATVPRG